MKWTSRRSTLLQVSFLFLFFALVTRRHVASAWDQEDHEIFDLVDEVEKVAGEEVNFYTLLGLETNANQKDISKGYRKQSLLWHPDKNDSPLASKRQKLIGVVAAILRDEEKRKRYDFFLRNGVPRWRGTGYYYRRHRPGLGSVLVGLLFGISVFQYLASWVLCLRRRSMFRDLVAEEAVANVRRAPRRSAKRSTSKEALLASLDQDGVSDSGSNASGRSTPASSSFSAATGQLPSAEQLLANAMQDPENDPLVQFPSPSVKDVLIVQLPRWIFIGLPSAVFGLGKKGTKGDDEVNGDSDSEDASAKSRKKKKSKARKTDGDDSDTGEVKSTGTSKKNVAAVRRMVNRRSVNPKYVPPSTGQDQNAADSAKEWTKEDEASLTELIAKFPPKTPGRWALISRALGREEREVVAKAKELTK